MLRMDNVKFIKYFMCFQMGPFKPRMTRLLTTPLNWDGWGYPWHRKTDLHNVEHLTTPDLHSLNASKG